MFGANVDHNTLARLHSGVRLAYAGLRCAVNSLLFVASLLCSLPIGSDSVHNTNIFSSSVSADAANRLNKSR